MPAEFYFTLSGSPHSTERFLFIIIFKEHTTVVIISIIILDILFLSTYLQMLFVIMIL